MALTERLQPEKVKEAARRQLEKVSEELPEDDVATSLNKVAIQEKVGAVRFAPTLGTAGLLKTEEGFDIVVDADAQDPMAQVGKVLRVEDSDWNLLSPRCRFTIAHELAQVLVLRVAGGNPNKDFFTRHEEFIDHLCNELASKLLIPEKKFLREVEGNVCDASRLHSVATNFLVSPEALARRLQYGDVKAAFRKGSGLVGFLRCYGPEDQPSISDTVARFIAGQIWGATAQDAFGLGPAIKKDVFVESSNFPAGRVVDELKLSIDVLARVSAEDQATAICERIWSIGPPKKILPCKLMFKRTSQNPLAFFLTIETADAPIESKQ